MVAAVRDVMLTRKLEAVEHYFGDAVLVIMGLVRALFVAGPGMHLIASDYSAIEAVVDRVSLEKHQLSKNAKDMGSAAQFVALSIIAVTWLIILLG